MKATMKKVLSMLLVVALTAGIAISGTIAYFTSEDSAVNVMQVGNVKIIQNEQERDGNGGLQGFTQGQSIAPAADVTGAKEAITVNGYEVNIRTGETYVDKIVSVTNNGVNAAYVRTIFAFPEAGEFDTTTDASEQWFHWNGVSDTDTDPANGWMWGSDKTTEWPGNNSGWDVVENVEINGKKYDIYVATNKNALAAGASTSPSLMGFFLDVRVDYDGTNYTFTDKNGKEWNLGDISDLDILVLTQAAQTDGFADAWTALDTAFGDVTAENAVAWFSGLSADTPAPPVEVPENAQTVSDFAGLSSALTVGGDYVINAPITVSEDLSVAADTNLYCTDANNVVSFENNSKISVNADQSLALYGVQMDGNGTYGFSTDGTIVYDADARRTTPLLNVGAGATLTLGTQTNIENVVAKGSAVISAKGTDENRASVVIEHASITNCAGESGTIINVDKAGDVVIGEGTVISNNASYNNNNHGIIRVYNAWDAANPSTVTMNGGEISNNYYSGNGMIGLYYGKMIMNGGEICDNAWFEDNQKHNGFYPVVYVHSNSQFVMNGGEISGNSVRFGVLNCLNSAIEPAIIINGGIVVNNTNTDNNKDAFVAALIEDEGTKLKSVSVSTDATVSGMVWDYYTGYYTLDEYFSKVNN